MDYYIYKTSVNDRWDNIAYKFYGNCYDIDLIIEANPHILLTPVLDAEVEVRIPIKENTQKVEGIPLWKQEI